MLRLAAPGPSDVIYDLGCGDGRIVIQAAKRHVARGSVSTSTLLRLIARATAAAQGVSDRATFVCGDLHEASLHDATVVCLYLLPDVMEPVWTQVCAQVRPGTRIVCHDYPVPDWPPEKTDLVRSAPARISVVCLWRAP